MTARPWQSYSLDEVKSIPILDVCTQLGINVEYRGRNAWCKLRDEHNPSTILHPESNTFFDFGTQEHGSNIDLVCYTTGKSFADAVRYLGESFALAPETSADARKRFRTMTRSDYARIGLHWDLATKNFIFPIDRCAPQKLLEIELRYQMSMNELRKQHPKTYARIIREKAIPYVSSLRNLYYLEVWNHYCFLNAAGRAFLFFDSERTAAHFSSLTQQLERAERSLYKAGQGTGLAIPEPKQYDPQRVVSRILTGRLSISIGPCTAEELSVRFAGPCVSFSLSYDRYVQADLKDIPHAASLTKDGIVISCRKQDLPLVRRRTEAPDISEEHPQLDQSIKSAEARKESPDQTLKSREPVLSH